MTVSVYCHLNQTGPAVRNASNRTLSVRAPPTKRVPTNSIRLRGRAAPMDETVNRAAAPNKTFFLPRRSLVKAARLAPTTQPRRRLLAAISVWASLNKNCRFMKT